MNNADVDDGVETRKVFFTGRVQGVGFRATARAIARHHAVTGWVRNEDNGSVLLEVQGETAAVDAFAAELQRDMGRFIKNSAASVIATVANEPDFSIRR